MNNENIVVVASNAVQMQEAQKSLVSYFQEKINGIDSEIKETEQNIEIARKSKWRISPFINLKSRLEKDFHFYNKIKAALDAGYTIIPNFNEIDIFAIRTTRKNPKKNTASGGENYVEPPDAQESNTPHLGEGQYVNADTINDKWQDVKRLEDGTLRKVMKSQAINFDIVDFPFKFVKPQILERTTEAMEKLCFDDIGILPYRNIRRGDPMIVGRIWMKKGYDKKCVSFLITWFVDTKAI